MEPRILILAGAGLLVLVAFVFLASTIVAGRRAKRSALRMPQPTAVPGPGFVDAPIDTSDWMPPDDDGVGGTAVSASDVVPGALLMSVDELIQQHSEVPAPRIEPSGGRSLDELLADIAAMAEGTGPEHEAVPPASASAMPESAAPPEPMVAAPPASAPVAPPEPVAPTPSASVAHIPAPPTPVEPTSPAHVVPAPLPGPAPLALIPEPVAEEPVPLAAWLVEGRTSAQVAVAPAPAAQRSAPIPPYRMIAPVELSFADGQTRVGVRPGTATFLKYQRLAQVLLADLHKTTPRA